MRGEERVKRLIDALARIADALALGVGMILMIVAIVVFVLLILLVLLFIAFAAAFCIQVCIQTLGAGG